MVVPVILVHGGAGNISDSAVPSKIDGMKLAVEKGYRVLSEGGSALDAAQASVEVMEADPSFNAGKGSVLNLDGDVEMDALLMEGTNLRAGSVGAIKNVLHPIAVARKVLENSPAVMLVGDGANRFARQQGFQIIPSYELITNGAIRSLESFKQNPKASSCELECGGIGTVGAVVVDSKGRVASATSTGGTTGKPPGRVGDTPLPGCGGYADDDVGAVSTTGKGESIMRVCLAHLILSLMEKGKSAQKATEEALNYMGSRVGNTAGAITLSRNGDIGIAFISNRMGWAFKKGNDPIVAGVDNLFTK